jgi:hypothetical protein
LHLVLLLFVHGLLLSMTAAAPSAVAKQCGEALSAPDLRKRAEVIIQDHKARFAHLFAKTSGFEAVSEYEKVLQTGGELLPLLFEMTKSDVEVAIYRQTRRRLAIARHGILNQHTTGTSGGSLNLQLRERAEADMLGVPYADYKKWPSEIKPKSAILQPVPHASLRLKRLANIQYGNDAYILKDEVLRARATLTPQDSLNRYIVGNQIQTSTTRKSRPASAWDQLYVPWASRSVIVPYLLPKALMFNHLGPTGDPYFFLEDDDYLPPHYEKLRSMTPAMRLKVSENWGDDNQSYVEAQIWGPIDLDDVKAFQFSRQPPKGEFLQELLRRQIEIRDARDHEPKYDKYGPRQYFTDAPIKIWKPNP